jgi:hypothetical protein
VVGSVDDQASGFGGGGSLAPGNGNKAACMGLISRSSSGSVKALSSAIYHFVTK